MAVVRRVGPVRWASAFHMAWRPSINSAGKKVNSDSPHPGSLRKRPLRFLAHVGGMTSRKQDKLDNWL